MVCTGDVQDAGMQELCSVGHACIHHHVLCDVGNGLSGVVTAKTCFVRLVYCADLGRGQRVPLGSRLDLPQDGVPDADVLQARNLNQLARNGSHRLAIQKIDGSSQRRCSSLYRGHLLGTLCRLVKSLTRARRGRKTRTPTVLNQPICFGDLADLLFYRLGMELILAV